jgi:branched-chain amino acid transport system substrate-binding protein
VSSHHRSHRRSRKAAIAGLAVLALTGAAACSSKDDEDSTGTTTAGAAGEGETTETTGAPAADLLGPENAATGDPITIGYVTDGADASFGSDEDQVATFEATVQYANEHLGGINGHPIEIEHCQTGNTPAGATQCAVDLASAGVAAVLVAVSSQDGTLFEGFAGSGIPYFTYTSANQSILLGAGAFLVTNPISQIAVPGLLAQEQGVDKVGFILIDVPAATGPITAIATPIFANLDTELQIIPIAPSVADMTPQIQEAISGGSELFTVTGADDFNINGVNGLRQLGFTGTVFLGNPGQAVLDALTTFEGLVGGGTFTSDPSDPDVQLLEAVLAEFSDLEPGEGDKGAFATALGFVRALTGSTDAVDAATITAALGSMPEVDLPLGGGITFQCGTAPVSFAPSICSTDVLQWSYTEDGEQTDFGLVEVPADVLTLG